MSCQHDPRLKYEAFRALVRAVPYFVRDRGTVTYRQMCNTVGIPWQLAGLYCGALGEFCVANGWPIANCIIVNEATEKPGSDFFEWKKSAGIHTGGLGAAQAEVRKFFNKFKSHSEMSRELYSKIDTKIKDFLGITA